MRDKPLILDVDDDDAGRYAVSRQLTQAGYEVRGATNGMDGLRIAKEVQPDLILLDVRLPDIDGFEVCRRLRDTPEIAGTPVIQMSASYIDTRSRVKGLDNGADAYLTEPVEPGILLATVNSLMRLKRAEQKVRRGSLQWQATFDAIADGVALIDLDCTIAQHNRAFENTGGKEFAAEACPAMLREMRSSGQRQSAEREWNGRTMAITLDPVKNERGDLEAAVFIAADITERKSFEQHLRHTAKLESIGVLAGGIAHDFNNLLTGILGNASVLLDALPQNTPEHGMAHDIFTAAESAADLTRQILAYSGKGRFVMQPVDFSRVATETRSFVRRFIPNNVELVYELAPGLPAVVADKSQIEQLMMNLIINAAESFLDNRRGTVTVRTAAERLAPGVFHPGENAQAGEYVSIEVADNGCGMDTATQNRIFDPFFTTKFAGRGLGLSAVHGIVAGHRGILRLESAPGRGTTFRLYFPAAAAADSAGETATEFPEEDGIATILVIDDESAVRSFARTALRARGYTVIVAESGPEALEKFGEERERIGLVLLDLTMPGMGGEETFERLRAMDGRVPIILSSGYNRSMAEERFRGKEIAGFLGKPYTGRQLAEAIQKAIKDSESTARSAGGTSPA